MLHPDLGMASSVAVAGNRQKDLHVGIEDRLDDVGGPPVRRGRADPPGRDCGDPPAGADGRLRWDTLEDPDASLDWLCRTYT